MDNQRKAKWAKIKWGWVALSFILGVWPLGVALIILGFVLMAGGTKATPEVFSEDIFSWRRITLAPILVVAGFAFEIYAILKRF